MSERDRLRRWWAWGFIIGDRLPEGEFRLGEANITHWAGARLRDARSKKRQLVHSTGVPWGFQLVPPQVWVYSDWAIEWFLDGPDFETAEALVRTDLAPRALERHRRAGLGPELRRDLLGVFCFQLVYDKEVGGERHIWRHLL